MKKAILVLLTGLLCLAYAGAQNFSDNDNQKAGREYERQASEAMEAGDYENAGKLADLAAIEYRKSREYADAQLRKFRAANAINLAQTTITDLENVQRVRKEYPTELAKANALLAEARALYATGVWAESRDKALAAIDALKGIKGVAATEPKAPDASGTVLPRYYVVVSRPKNTDCFWNISKMSAVYGNPIFWQKLWKANLKAMRDPENPSLIYPGMIIEIPPLNGETREGTYDPSLSYPPLAK